ncbi:hypothetical protein KGM_215522 [Danaus plexippus plexippus]|uniref:Uncharacterized protein n=1 Tax=Danaus plexippus plexippus TaxID=278856 RepID=A0A212F379_DANPL|nr:hypothetical protein KGM_215522 [Danaus plexippus plexippus]
MFTGRVNLKHPEFFSISEECSGSEEDIDFIQNEDEIEILESDESMQAKESSDSEEENLQKLSSHR